METPYSNLDRAEGHTQNYTQDEEPTGWKAKLLIASVIIGAIFAFISLILAIVAYNQMAGYTNDYDNTVNSWEVSPIVELVWVNGPNCGNPEYTPIRSSWPGTSPACNCRGVYNASNTDSGSCSSDQLSKGCRTQSGLPPVTLDVIPGITFCIWRAGPNALNRPTDPKPPNYECPTGFSVCGINTTGAICWPNTIDCPITDIGFLNYLVEDNYTWADGRQLIQSGGTNNWFYWRRGGTLNPQYFDLSVRSPASQPSTTLPLVNMNFQPADPCTLSGCGYSGRGTEYSNMERAYNNSQTTYGYMLNSLPCDGGCQAPDTSNSVSPSGRDIRYFRIWNITEQTLYSYYWPEIPSYYVTTNNNYVWILSARSEIQWDASCPESRASVQDHQGDVDNVRGAQFALLFFTGIAFIFLSIVFPCLQYFKKEEYAKMKKCEKCCKYSLKVATLTCTIVTMAIALGTLYFWNDINNYNKEVTGSLTMGGGNSCSDPLTDETFSALGDTFFKLSNKNIINTASMSVTTVFDGVNDVIQKFF